MVNASTATEPGSGNQETYASHFALMIDANKSMSNGPKTVNRFAKAA